MKWLDQSDRSPDAWDAIFTETNTSHSHTTPNLNWETPKMGRGGSLGHEEIFALLAVRALSLQSLEVGLKLPKGSYRGSGLM